MPTAPDDKILGPNPVPGGEGTMYTALDPGAEGGFDPDPFVQIGQTGLKRFAQGYSTIDEEWLQDLKGIRGIKAYREISDNSSTVGAILFLIDSMCRAVEWEIDAAADDPASEGAAEFVEQCIEDLEQSWPNLIGDIIRGICVYGWSAFELVFKMRKGQSDDPIKSSNFNDNKMGWAKIAPRSQDTLYGWQFDPNGQLLGMYQMAPPNFELVFIPLRKLLLFRSIGTTKDNPEGRSALRNCYIAYTLQKKIQTAEAIGISRNLAGLPVMTVPLRLMSINATDNEKAQLADFQSMVSRVKSDEYAGLVLPAETTQDGNPTGYTFKLLSGTTGKTAETTPVLERLEKSIARAFLADWLFLGSGSTGSWALASSKTNVFAQALGGFLQSVQDVFNDAIAQLMRVNGNHDPLTYPTIRHGDLEKVPLEEIAGPITSLMQVGAISPDDELESWLRDIAGAPQHEVGEPELGLEPEVEIQPGEAPAADLPEEKALQDRDYNVQAPGDREFNTQAPGPREFNVQAPGGMSMETPAEETEDELEKDKGLTQEREFNVQAPGGNTGQTVFSQYAELIETGRAEPVPDEHLINGSNLARRTRQKLKSKRKTVRAMKPRQKGKLTNLQDVDPTSGRSK